MKNVIKYIFGPVFLLSIVITGCEGPLEEEVFSQLAPANFLNTKQGLESVLAAAYGEQALNGWQGKSVLNLESWCTDEEWETSGGENRTAVLMIGFTWDPTLDWAKDNMWDRKFRSIRNANVLLENIEAVTGVDDALKAQLTAEARFVRAVNYHYLYGWYGPVPIRTESGGDLEVARATEQEMLSFIETEFTESIADLPEPATAVYGRGNKGAARAFLTKFYLNTKQWQKAADAARSVIDMNAYSLFPDYEKLFTVENERNSEFIWVHQAVITVPGNLYMNGAFPPNFGSDPVTGAVHTDGMRNWAAQYRLYDEFYDSFDPSDKRRRLILNEYIHKGNGSTVRLSSTPDNRRSIKYVPDPNSAGNDQGNDIPEIRYADILLARAEALNELNGPTQEAIDLINEVRERTGLADLVLSDFDKNSLRDHLLNERRWEFFTERKRREDLIRHGKFISSAISRGKPAQPYHVRFPIPQAEVDANSNMVQNEGYGGSN